MTHITPGIITVDMLKRKIRPLPFADLTQDDCVLADGWRPADQEWFVDFSGFGREGESALTQDQFMASLLEYVRDHPTDGYAITDQGQFQLYVQAFERIPSQPVKE